jgi:hypothetical protein
VQAAAGQGEPVVGVAEDDGAGERAGDADGEVDHGGPRCRRERRALDQLLGAQKNRTYQCNAGLANPADVS